MARWLKAGSRMLCALRQFGSSVSAVNSPSPAKLRACCRPAPTRFSKRCSSHTSSVSAKPEMKTASRLTRASAKIGP